MTKFSDLPFDFQIGNRHQAKGDKPVLLLNPKNDKFLFDVDGAGGARAKKIGSFVGLDVPQDYEALPGVVADFDFVMGNRKSAEKAGATLIYNPKNGNFLLDHDGIGDVKAVKIGQFDLDL